jgi:hypothetical protein
MRLRTWFSTAVLLGFLVGGPGCSGSGLVNVQGLVTLDGKPLANAHVNFATADGKGHPAVGLSDRDGRFRLTTYKPDDGALPGEYRVTVVVTVLVEADPSVTAKYKGVDLSKITKEEMLQMRADVSRRYNEALKKAPPSTVPDAYGNFSTTPLLVRLTASGPVHLELKKAGP